MSGNGKLSEDDRELWNRVLDSVKPLKRGRSISGVPVVEARIENTEKTGLAGNTQDPVQNPGLPKRKQPPPKPTAAPYFPPVSTAKKKTPSLSGLEPRQKRGLARGHTEVDDRLDLHGMRQATAFHTLTGFLRRAQARRLKTVLVITGKGSSAGAEPMQEAPGVLRRLVPQWLAGDEFRGLVIGYELASRRHGGEGALYVRIRRLK